MRNWLISGTPISRVGVAFVVMKDVAANPIDVGLFGAERVVVGSNGIAHLFKEFLFTRLLLWNILHVDLCD